MNFGEKMGRALARGNGKGVGEIRTRLLREPFSRGKMTNRIPLRLRASVRSTDLSQRESTDMRIQCGLGFAKQSFLGKGFAKPRLFSARRKGLGRNARGILGGNFFGRGRECPSWIIIQYWLKMQIVLKCEYVDN